MAFCSMALPFIQGIARIALPSTACCCKLDEVKQIQRQVLATQLGNCQPSPFIFAAAPLVVAGCCSGCCSCCNRLLRSIIWLFAVRAHSRACGLSSGNHQRVSRQSCISSFRPFSPCRWWRWPSGGGREQPGSGHRRRSSCVRLIGVGGHRESRPWGW